MGEVGILACGVAPVVLADAEVVEHRLRAQESRRHGERGDPAAAQLAGHGEGEPDHRDLHQVVEKVAPVVGAEAVGHLDDEPAAALHHERYAPAAGDDVGMDGTLEHGEPLVEVELPEAPAPLGERVAAPDVVDQDVEAALLVAHPLEERAHLVLPRVVHPGVDAVAAVRGDELRRLFDGLGPVLAARRPAAYAPAGAVDRGPGFPQHAGDAAPGAAGGAGDHRDLAVQCAHGCVLLG